VDAALPTAECRAGETRARVEPDLDPAATRAPGLTPGSATVDTATATLIFR
jgi:hypothetical protein